MTNQQVQNTGQNWFELLESNAVAFAVASDDENQLDHSEEDKEEQQIDRPRIVVNELRTYNLRQGNKEVGKCIYCK